METFKEADHEAVEGKRKNFMVVILTEQLEMDEVRKDIKKYLQTHTYIDATRNTQKVPERLR